MDLEGGKAAPRKSINQREPVFPQVGQGKGIHGEDQVSERDEVGAHGCLCARLCVCENDACVCKGLCRLLRAPKIEDYFQPVSYFPQSNPAGLEQGHGECKASGGEEVKIQELSPFEFPSLPQSSPGKVGEARSGEGGMWRGNGRKTDTYIRVHYINIAEFHLVPLGRSTVSVSPIPVCVSSSDIRDILSCVYFFCTQTEKN